MSHGVQWDAVLHHLPSKDNEYFHFLLFSFKLRTFHTPATMGYDPIHCFWYCYSILVLKLRNPEISEAQHESDGKLFQFSSDTFHS